MSLRRAAFAGALALLLAFCAPGCTRVYRFEGLDLATGRRLALRADLEAEVDFSGRYLSPQLGELKLAQRGEDVRGSFRYQRDGAAVYGTLQGEVAGELVRFEWHEVHEYLGEFTSARVRGHGYFLRGPPAPGTSTPRIFGRRTAHVLHRPGLQARSFPRDLPAVAFSASRQAPQ